MFNLDIVKQWKPNEGMELEAAIRNKVNFVAFNHTLSHILYLCNDNKVVQQDTLDVIYDDRSRASITGAQNISKFCTNGRLPTNAIKIVKTLIKKHDSDDYNVRIRLSKETPVTEVKTTNIEMLRLKKRVSVSPPNFSDYRYDFTIVKELKGDDMTQLYKQKQSYEIEMEYIGETEPDLDIFKDRLVDLIKAYYNDSAMTTITQKINAVKEYHNVCKELIPKHADIDRLVKHISSTFKNENKSGFTKTNLFFIGAKPVTLEKHNLNPLNTPNIFNGYKATIKADGERTLLYVADDGSLYLISSRMDFKYAGKSKSFIPRSLLDGELIASNGMAPFVYIFDCYILGGQSIIHKDLDARIEAIKAFNNKSTNYYKFKVKEYRNVLEAEDMMSESYPFETDGIIYMPTGPAKVNGTWEECFKWKPHHQNTIDFLVRFDKTVSAHYVGGDLIQTLSLYVGSAPITPKDYFQSHGKKYIAIPFVTEGGKVHKMKITKGQRCENGDPIVDNHVIECYYNDVQDTWVPYRVRYDKTWDALVNKTITTNNMKSALNIWNSIIDPIRIQDVVDDSVSNDTKHHIKFEQKYYDRSKQRTNLRMKSMNDYHNKVIKLQQTFSQLAKNGCKSILDVACGKAGDLHKWIQTGFSTVLGVDIYEDNILNYNDGAYKRLSETNLPNNFKYVFVPMDSSQDLGLKQIKFINNDYTKDLVRCLWGLDTDKKELKHLQGLAKQKFDVISCQFALHYFFESKDTLKGLLDNIQRYLKPGGYFVGTVFDGTSVANLFTPSNSHVEGTIDDVPVWWIDKKYDGNYSKKKFGQKIEVYVESINKTHDEYLVPYELLKDHLNKIGLRELNETECKAFDIPSSSVMFGEIGNNSHLTHAEKSFSNLNRWFIFKNDKST